MIKRIRGGALLLLLTLLSCQKEKLILEKYSTLAHEELAVPAALQQTVWQTVDFVSTNTGLVGGTKGALLRTTDGGSTWQNLSNASLGDIRKLQFSSATTGLALTTNGLYRTTTSGASWSMVKAGSGLGDVEMVNATTGFLVGTWGYLAQTTDGGRTWREPWYFDPSNDFVAVSFADANTGIAISDRNSFKTTDGGRFWESSGSLGELIPRAFKLYPDGKSFLFAAYNQYSPHLVEFAEYLYAPNATRPEVRSSHDLRGMPIYGFAHWDGTTVAVGEKTLLRRHPDYAVDGTSWVGVLDEQGVTFQHDFRAADFADATTLYVVGTQGLIARFHYQ